MMRTLALGAAGSLMLLGAANRTLAFRTHRVPAAGHLAAGLALLGMSVTINVPPVAKYLDLAVWHQPNLTFLLSHCATLGAAVEALRAVGAADPAHRLPPRRLYATAAAFALALTLTYSPALRLPEDPELFDHHAADPSLAPYWVTYLAAMTVATACICRNLILGSRSQDGAIARSLQLIALGVGGYTLFSVLGLLEVTRLAGLAPAPVMLAVLVAATLACGTGAVLPVVWCRVAARLRRHRLNDLWREATATFPHVRADTNAPASDYRALIEIHDGLAEMRSRGLPLSERLTAVARLPHRGADDPDAGIHDLIRAASRKPTSR